jgi:hypothetical protein
MLMKHNVILVGKNVVFVNTNTNKTMSIAEEKKNDA